MIYKFNKQSLVFGYDNDQLIGMFVLYEGNKLTKDEMFEIFDNRVDLMKTVPLMETTLPVVPDDPTDDELSSVTEEIMEICGDIYDRAADSSLYDSECQYQIAKTVH